MENYKQIIVLRNLKVFKGSFDKETIDKELFGYLQDLDCSEGNCNARMSHKFILAGKDVYEQKGFICECTDGFISEEAAIQHYNRHNKLIAEQESEEVCNLTTMELIIGRIYLKYGLLKNDWYIKSIANYFNVETVDVDSCMEKVKAYLDKNGSRIYEQMNSAICVQADEMHENIMLNRCNQLKQKVSQTKKSRLE